MFPFLHVSFFGFDSGTCGWQAVRSCCEGYSFVEPCTSILLKFIADCLCQLRARMFCMIFDSRIWPLCTRRLLCWKLLLGWWIYIYIYISVHYMFFCKMVFTQDKEKKKSALNDRTRVPCFSCFFMFWTCFFLMFLLHSGKSRSWAERSNSSSRFLFFWCMITKPKNSFGNCVLQGQHWKGCFERWLSQGVVLDIWVFWNNLIFFDVIAKIQGAGWCLQVEVCFLSIGIELHVSPWFILNCCTSKEKKSLEAKHYNLTKDCVFARFVFFSKETLHVSSGPWDFEEPQWRPDQGFPLHFLCMIEWFYHFNLLQENTSLKDKMQKVPFFLGLCIILILVYLYI